MVYLGVEVVVAIGIGSRGAVVITEGSLLRGADGCGGIEREGRYRNLAHERGWNEIAAEGSAGECSVGIAGDLVGIEDLSGCLGEVAHALQRRRHGEVLLVAVG